MDLQDKVSQLTPLKYTALTNDDIMRYSRQLLLPELGVKGESLMKSSLKLYLLYVWQSRHKTTCFLSSQVR